VSIPLLRYGFRPFFLAVGLSGILLVPWWASSFVWGIPLGTAWPPTLWHSHEMLFGFIGAAVAGFLLTAVPSWTGERGFAGRPLALLCGVWLLGRLLVSTSTLWPMPRGKVRLSSPPRCSRKEFSAPSTSSSSSSSGATSGSSGGGCNPGMSWCVIDAGIDGGPRAAV
jgi:hypothetical protein